MPTTDAKSSIVHSWATGEDAWNTEMDNNFKRLSRSSYQLVVLDRDLSTPPGSPADGDAYLVAAGGSGDWAGQDENIAYWDGTAWVFYTPNEGWYCDVLDEDKLYRFDGTAWAEYLGAGGGGEGGPTGEWDFVETIVVTPGGGGDAVVSIPTGCAKVLVIGERVKVTASFHEIRGKITGAANNQHPYTFYRHESDTADPVYFEGEGTSEITIANAGMSTNSVSDFELLIGLGTAGTYTTFESRGVATDSSAGSPVSVQFMASGSYKTSGRPASITIFSAFADLDGLVHVYKSAY